MLLLSVSLLASLALPQKAMAGDVARLLEERCAACHSEGSEEPKARKKWALASDLQATARDPNLIVPGDPDGSEIYAVIDFDDMPPSDSDSAPFTESEKALLASWIRAGAVVPARDLDSAAESTQAPDPEEESSNPFLLWISHFHPTLIHFPIALLTAAFLAELLARVRPGWKTEGAASFCLALGALSALPSAFLGWMLAENLSHHGFDLELHRWLGSVTAVGALLVWWGSRRWPTRRLLLLLILAGVVGVTGHTGGVLSYGAAWLKPPF